uniref:ABC transmembrane type-1 domain-containing protein n=1 Tax=Lactuca sativa TaxID=4236 RepID=A0A9R1X8U5_LACSA|nr:hypothetical protein LSAT_V11C500259700 [Lactuca sativa]
MFSCSFETLWILDLSSSIIKEVVNGLTSIIWMMIFRHLQLIILLIINCLCCEGSTKIIEIYGQLIMEKSLLAMFLLILPELVYGNLLEKNEKKLQEAYGVAGGIAEQAFSSIKTVHLYVGEERMMRRLSTALHPTLILGIKQGLLKGFFSVALESYLRLTSILNSFLNNHYNGLGASLMNIKHFAKAKILASLISEIINRVPPIDSTDRQGKTISIVNGALEFKDIDFTGSGKSTVVNLLERFYDPIEGEKVKLKFTNMPSVFLNILLIQYYLKRMQVGVAQQWYDELVEPASLTQKQDGSIFIDYVMNTSLGTSEVASHLVTGMDEMSALESS